MAVEGLSNLQRRFHALPAAVQKAVRETMERNADEIVDMMKRLAPVESGALRDSIGWTWGAAPKGSMSLGTVGASPASPIAITIYAGTRDKALGGRDAFYARFQEYGTKNMPANPFFWPSIRTNRTRGRSRLSRNARKAAEKAFNG